MTATRKQHSPKFKAQVALEAIRGEKTLSQLGSQFKLHPIQIAKWRKVALDRLPEVFVDGRTRQSNDGQADLTALYEQIGRQKVEMDCHSAGNNDGHPRTSSILSKKARATGLC